MAALDAQHDLRATPPGVPWQVLAPYKARAGRGREFTTDMKRPLDKLPLLDSLVFLVPCIPVHVGILIGLAWLLTGFQAGWDCFGKPVLTAAVVVLWPCAILMVQLVPNPILFVASTNPKI